ncbi:hypothetical protein FAIPA1_210022 [Frankia sp. AiPs1]
MDVPTCGRPPPPSAVRAVRAAAAGFVAFLAASMAAELSHTVGMPAEFR